jgi:4-amino-4-deoxy-L-arabinose transferase-like glycosyltransferase
MGLFTTLMENDSAQFAVMAMRMFQEQDWLSLWKGTEEYLDKPHLHYWLAAISYSCFGVHDWAYRIPAILSLILGAYSCFGLGKGLYNVTVGSMAALIFLSAQTIVLSGIDVRTDAVLTGFTAFALWQLTHYLQTGNLKAILLGAIGAAMAFSTKGQIALLVIALPLISHLFLKGNWNRLKSYKIAIGLLVFVLAIAPMLYAYYHQFDLHPEKVIRGKGNRSGIRFIFWEQSFERLSGEGIGKNSSDYFFFFHTFLWVFLPWTVPGILALSSRLKVAGKAVLRKGNWNGEWVTAGGITLIFILISFAQFKLPHYLNILIPLFAVLTASFLDAKYQSGNKKILSVLVDIQLGILVLVFLALSVILFWIFPISPILGGSFVLISVFTTWLVWHYSANMLYRLIGFSLLGSVLLNAGLNGYFYPRLLEYQAGSQMAKLIKKEQLPIDQIHKLDNEHTWSLDFYFGKPVEQVNLTSETGEESLWLYITEKQRQELLDSNVKWDREFSVNQFRITRLQGKFINPATRNQVVGKRYLLHIVATVQ